MPSPESPPPSPPESPPHTPVQPLRFSGKVALVTGVSDRGIGAAIVQRLAEEGAAVVCAGLETPARLLKKLAKRSLLAACLECNITREADVQRVLDDCRARYGRLDILVNNAGVEHAGQLDSLTPAQIDATLAVNLTGAIRTARAALPLLSAPGGVIVNISSILGSGGCPGYSVYSASKAGLDGFTRSLAWELAPQGVRVVGVAPGLVLTPMIAKHFAHFGPEVRQSIRDCHPLDMGQGTDVAAAVAFLASGEARWITGITLPLGWAPHFPLPVAALLEE